MSDTTANDMPADDGTNEDRLPWLETVDDDYEDGPSPIRIALFVILGMIAIAAIVAGVMWWNQNRANSGTGELIAAQEGDYKVKPDEPGGMKAKGEGDSVFSTSEGVASNGSVDLSAVPEAPINGKAAPKADASAKKGTAKVVARVPQSSEALTARQPVTAAPRAASTGGGGAVVQLGSFPNEAGANTAWSRLSGRYNYLAPLGKSVQRAEVNGNTVYRLRVNAGSSSQAGELCGKLKVAGEACFVASN